MGLAFVPVATVAQALADGRLVRLLPEWRPRASGRTARRSSDGDEQQPLARLPHRREIGVARQNGDAVRQRHRRNEEIDRLGVDAFASEEEPEIISLFPDGWRVIERMAPSKQRKDATALCGRSDPSP